VRRYRRLPGRPVLASRAQEAASAGSGYTPPVALALLPLPPMLGHLCFVPVRPGPDGLADGDEAAAGCELAVPVCALVDALAMVRPRARLAPRAPAPTAVPMSGRVILTCFSFASPAGPTAGPDRGGPREPAQISRPSPTGW
jgi:hypothetical protein